MNLSALSLWICIFLLLIIYIALCFQVSKTKRRPKLDFIHIPKTAGTTIEQAALQSGYRWGKYKPVRKKKMLDNPSDTSRRCSRWHKPYKHIYPKHEYMNKSNTFCVFRDPVERLISEYGHYKRNSKATNYNNAKDLNVWLRRVLDESRIKAGNNRDCHLLPQHDFIYDDHNNRVCKHVLSFSNLDHEFNMLMKKKGIDVNLGNKQENKSNVTLTAKDIDADNMAKIRQLYKKDYHFMYHELDSKRG